MQVLKASFPAFIYRTVSLTTNPSTDNLDFSLLAFIGVVHDGQIKIPTW